MLHPNQFHVNEAWIAFQLNATPVTTDLDGDFNCVSLMDAASCFMLSSTLIPAIDKTEPSQLEARRLLKQAWAHHQTYPARLILPHGQFATHLTTAARKLGIEVVNMPEVDLLPIIGEAREGYEEYMRDGDEH